MENSKELIIKYFFNEHLKVKEIAEIIHTSSSYITKIIKLDKRYLEEQHRLASLELSKAKHLSNETYRKWNISAYKYNPSKHRYEFDENLGRSADIPKYIKER